jgi:putative pyruvate formate lyase activating enzyme
MMLALQKRGAENINFVTPDHMLPMALIALGEARREGMNLPLVYNCSGYQKLDIIRRLEGIIDIYLVDMRYNDDTIALQYSGCHNYVATNRAAVKEMYRQVGNLKCDEREIGISGIIIRHLVLPNRLSGSAGIFKFLAEEVSPAIHVSLMSQYFPAYKAPETPAISRRITNEEFEEAVDAFHEAGLSQGFIQELEYETV